MRSYPGCWVLPGGGVDPGEPLAAAAAREVAEETGLEVAAASLRLVALWESAFPLCPDTFVAAGHSLKVHTLMAAFACRVEGEQPPLCLQPQEVDLAVWLSAEDVAALLESRLSGRRRAAGGEEVEAERLCGVYPNGLSPPEGLGLAHHFILTRWLEERGGGAAML